MDFQPLLRQSQRVGLQPVFGLMLLLLAACGTRPSAEPTPTVVSDYNDPVPSNRSGGISASGVLRPVRQVALSFGVEGFVESVAVEAGDSVESGQTLAQLDAAAAQRAVRQAEAALAAAEAQLSLLESDARAAEIASAEAQLEAAQAGLARAVAQRELLLAAELPAARAQVDAAMIDEWVARDAYERRGWSIGHIATLQLQAAVAARSAAEAQLAQIEGEEGAELHVADAEVWAAAAQRDMAQAQLDQLRASTAAEIAMAEAEVVNAETALEEAQERLVHSTLSAPFDGVVAAVGVRIGEWAVPGAVAVTLADLSSWRIDTKNVGELEIGRVEVGQEVQVRVNAFRDEALAGRVAAISPVAVVQQGDTTYTLIIELEPTVLNLRPGMTAQVEIPLAQ